MEKQLEPLEIEIWPYLTDHCFGGRAVLPAVEAMDILAQSIKKTMPGLDTACITGARFEKFLPLPPSGEKISAYTETVILDNGDVSLKLLTKTRLARISMTRVKEHASICFSPKNVSYKPCKHKNEETDSSVVSIDSRRLYKRFVPFGPSYHNLKGNTLVEKSRVRARALASEHKRGKDFDGDLGSPFPLDAAFHAACVWGRCFADMVAFPVGFERRLVLKPTMTGRTYDILVIPIEIKGDTLVFDAEIRDSAGRIHESVSGLLMRKIGTAS